MNKCKDCRNYSAPPVLEPQGQGNCRRYPPRAYLLPGGQPGQIMNMSVWPVVQPDQFCGEFVSGQDG